MSAYVRLFYCLAVFSCYWKVSISQTVTISANAEEVVEGQSLGITCVAPSSSSGASLAIEINSVVNNSIPRDANGRNALFTLGPLTRVDNGSMIRCRDVLEGINSDFYTLVVNYTGRVNDLVTQGAVGTGDMFVATYTIDANPPVIDVEVRNSSNALVSGSGGWLSANSTTAVISFVRCRHGGNYTLQGINAVGTGMATTFTVSVTQVPASFTSTNIVLDKTVELGDTDVSLQEHIVGCSDGNGSDVVLGCSMSGVPTLSQTVNTDVSTPVLRKRSDFVTCGLSRGSSSLTCTVTNDLGSTTTNVQVSYSSAACHDVTCCLAPVLVVVFIAILIIAAAVVITVIVVVLKKKK